MGVVARLSEFSRGKERSFAALRMTINERSFTTFRMTIGVAALLA